MSRSRKGRAVSVSLTNVESFLHTSNLYLSAGGIDLSVDIAFGGSFFVLVDADAADIDLSAHNLDELIRLAADILAAVAEKVEIHHPLIDIQGAANVEFFGRPRSARSSQRNVVISAQGQVDRSPCGTGTSAKLASLYAKGKIKPGQAFINESLTGTQFVGEIEKPAVVGSYQGIVPVITGSAYICGYSSHVIDETDPLKYGFSL